MRKYKPKGFTLIELLAVIVILGIIMLVAIPAVTGYITNARNDSYLDDAAMFVDAIQKIASTKNRLPMGDKQVALFRVTGPTGVQLDAGGKQSPFGYNWDEGFTWVAVAKVDGEYMYAFMGNDLNGNFVPLSTLDYIRKNDIKVQNLGSVDLARKCLGGIALPGNEDSNTTNCDGNLDGNFGDTGFLEYRPARSEIGNQNFTLQINGIPEEGNRTWLTLIRVYTDNRIDGGVDLGYGN